MMAREPLFVWLDGVHIATLAERRATLTLAYTERARDIYRRGAPVLSVALPVSDDVYAGRVVAALVGGLLPEGSARQILAYDFGLSADDSFGLLGELGRDCAGALVIQPQSAQPPTAADGYLLAQSDTELSERLERLRIAPLGVGGEVRVSLAGMQEKLVVAQSSGGGWALPAGGAASTHILKPAHPFLPFAVENEAFCMKLLHHLGLPAAEVAVISVGGASVLAVRRFDRAIVDGEVRRVHQEDLLQAMGRIVDPGGLRKYEATGGPTLMDVARVVRSWTDRRSLLRLFDLMVANVIIGNADAHARNVSLLHPGPQRVELAPAYDVMSTAVYSPAGIIPAIQRPVSRTGAMFVGGVRQIDEVGVAAMAREGMSWGLSNRDVTSRLVALIEACPAAIARAVAEIEPPAALLAVVEERGAQLKKELSALSL